MALECTSKRVPPLCDLDIVLVRSADGRIFDVECGLLYQSKFLVDLITANGAECCSSGEHLACGGSDSTANCGKSWWHGHEPEPCGSISRPPAPPTSDGAAAAVPQPPVVELVENTEGSMLLRVNVHARIIEKVLAWCRRMAEHPVEAERWCRADPHMQLTEFEEHFFDIENNTICEIINAAYVLKIGTLTEAGCKVIADKIRHKSPAEMRKAFGIKNDFTPHEQTKIRRETRRMLSTMSALERAELPPPRITVTVGGASDLLQRSGGGGRPALPPARTTFARMDCGTVSVSASATITSASTGSS